MILLYYFSLLFLSIVQGQQGGLRLGVSVSGANKALTYFTPALLAQVKKLVIPGATEKNFKYNSITFSSVSLQRDQISNIPGKAVQIALAGLSISTNQIWFQVFDKIIGIKIHCSGHIWASISNTNIVATETITVQNGKPVVQSSINIGWGPVSVHHSFEHESCKIADSIVEALIGNFNKKIADELKKQLPPILQKNIEQVIQNALKHFGVVDVGDGLVIDYSLVSNPIITSQGITLVAKAAFAPKAKKISYPFGPSPMQTFTPKEDVQIDIGDWVFDTFSWSAASLNLLTISKTLDGKKYNTSVFKMFYPKLYNMCPNCLIHFSGGIPPYPTKVDPTIRFNQGAGQLIVPEVVTNITFLKTATSTTPYHVIDVAMSGTFDMKLGVNPCKKTKGQCITWDLAMPKYNLTVVWSAFNVSAKALYAITDALLNGTVIPKINNMSGVPIPLPSNIALVGPEVRVGTHVLDVASDITFGGAKKMEEHKGKFVV